MPVGLRLKLLRDLAFQFPLSNNYRTNTDRMWSVLGSHDYLQVELLEKLESLAQGDTHWVEGNNPSQRLEEISSVSHTGELVLVPDPWAGVWQDREALVASQFSQITQLDNTIQDDIALLFVLRLSLSSLALETPSEIPQIDRLVRSLPPLLNKCFRDTGAPSSIEMTSWLTLGGPDAVCLAIPKSPNDLHALNQFVEAARNITLKELRTTITSWPDFKETSFRNFKEGHAFASVQANLCYNTAVRSYEFLRKGSLWNREHTQSPQVKFPCRISVGPGHEAAVLNRLALAGINVDRMEVTWGHRCIHIEFEHLIDVILALRAGLVDDNATPGMVDRNADVSGIRTTVACVVPSPSKVAVHSRNAKWSDPLVKSLREMEASFCDFAGTRLGKLQRLEFRQVFMAFFAALQRNDRSCSVRDLFPFFVQLGRALEQLKAVENKSLQDDVYEMCSHLMRALRNRIEYRGEPLDPAFPNTLEYGASKLISAFTVTVWLAWELLSRNSQNRQPNEQHCASDYFAAVVSAGTKGEVRGRRTFPEWSMPKTTQRGKWNSPLSQITISGPTLAQPEMAFVFSIHEMAEINSWIGLPAAHDFRKAIYHWARDQYAMLVTHAISTSIGNLNDAEEEEMTNINLAFWLRLFSTDGPPVPDGRGNWTPFLFLDESAHDSVKNWSSFRTIFNKVSNNKPMRWFDHYKRVFDPWTQEAADLTDKIIALEKTLAEVIPDFVMCVCVAKLINDKPWLVNVDNIYKSLATTIVNSRKGTVKERYRSAIVRWALLRGYTFDPDAKPIPDFKSGDPVFEALIKAEFAEINKDDMDDILDELTTLDACFSPGNEDPVRGLSSILIEFSNNIPNFPLGIVSNDAIIASLLELFRRTWKARPDESDTHGHPELDWYRIQMILGFWGKSQRFCLESFFEEV